MHKRVQWGVDGWVGVIDTAAGWSELQTPTNNENSSPPSFAYSSNPKISKKFILDFFLENISGKKSLKLKKSVR